MIRRARISNTIQHNITKPSIETLAPEPDTVRNFIISDTKRKVKQEDNDDKDSDIRNTAIEPRRKEYKWSHRNNITSEVIYSYG